MATEAERNWTAHLVIASEHAGLSPAFKMLENEIRRVLARVDEPRQVMDYLIELRLQSARWLRTYTALKDEK